MAKVSALGAEDPGFESRLRQDFSGSHHTGDLKIGTPVATLPGAWRYRVSAGTGRPSVSILWLGEVESWICNFYLSVAAYKIVQIYPWDTLACCWDVKQPTNNATFDHVLLLFAMLKITIRMVNMQHRYIMATCHVNMLPALISYLVASNVMLLLDTSCYFLLHHVTSWQAMLILIMSCYVICWLFVGWLVA